MAKLEGLGAIATGASSGRGEATLKVFTTEGASVALVHLTTPEETEPIVGMALIDAMAGEAAEMAAGAHPSWVKLTEARRAKMEISMINRRTFANLLTATPVLVVGCSPSTSPKLLSARSQFSYSLGVTTGERLIPPEGRQINVAFTINPGVQVIDVAGPWEVFQDTYKTKDDERSSFNLFTVSDTSSPIRGSGGLLITPNFTVDNALKPDLIVVPHFDHPRPSTRETAPIHQWIKDSHQQAALTMSVCTGAFQLAKTGLLDGLPATTNQRAYDNSKNPSQKSDYTVAPVLLKPGASQRPAG